MCRRDNPGLILNFTQPFSKGYFEISPGFSCVHWVQVVMTKKLLQSKISVLLLGLSVASCRYQSYDRFVCDNLQIQDVSYVVLCRHKFFFEFVQGSLVWFSHKR